MLNIKKVVSYFAFLILTLTSAGSADAQINRHWFYYVGQQQLVADDYKGAIETLNVLLRADGKAYEGFFLRGIAKYNLNDLLGAENDFTTAIKENPVYTLAYHYRAITRAMMGNYDDALADFREAIELRPDLSGPYYSRGVTLLLSQQFSEAIVDFDTYIRYNPRVAEAYVHRGTSYLYLKDTISAMDNYSQAIRTNRDWAESYLRRGVIYLARQQYPDALSDFNSAIANDSTYIAPYFNRALVYNATLRPMLALKDFDRVLELDPTSSLTYFNRAIIRSEIGDLNRAMDDYNAAARLSPDNVLLYYNRAGLNMEMGNIKDAITDYDKAIELYPDFANAYLNRAILKSLMRDERGARRDRQTAESKIAAYRSRLADDTGSIYADTSRNFDRLLSFDTKFGATSTASYATSSREAIALRPMFRFTYNNPVKENTPSARRYNPERLATFYTDMADNRLILTNQPSNISADSLIIIDRQMADRVHRAPSRWTLTFGRSITQSLIKQYTSSINTLSAAIEQSPTNPFLYLNRGAIRAEMVEFISSIDGAQRIAIESDPSQRLRSTAVTYNYDDAIADMNAAAKLYPEFAYVYYNRANLLALSGQLPEAYEDYTRAIELYPNFADAYYNRGVVQIYMKDTAKGLLDLSKAGELGLQEAYRTISMVND